MRGQPSLDEGFVKSYSPVKLICRHANTEPFMTESIMSALSWGLPVLNKRSDRNK